MNLYWQRGDCVRLESGDSSLLVNPPESARGSKSKEADVILFSSRGGVASNAAKAAKGAFVIDIPGEYNVKDFFIIGVDARADGKTTYIIESEGIRLCHLTDIGEKEFSDEELSALADIDVLMVSVGDSVERNESAAKVVNQIEPRVVVPIGFGANPITFLKEMGSGDVEAQAKLNIKKKDLPQEETEVILLSS